MSGYSAPITLGPYYIPDRPISRLVEPQESDSQSRNVPSSKSLMIIMIVAPVCADIALIIFGCILLAWYTR